MKPDFIIVSPKNLNGGTIVLHELCRELARQGENARVFYINSAEYRKGAINKIVYWKSWLTWTVGDLIKQAMFVVSPKLLSLSRVELYKSNSLKGCRRKIIPFVSNKCVVVYPEMIYGNPLHAKRVVRWLLSYNRWGNDTGAFSKNDLFFAFREIYNDARLNPNGRTLCTQFYDWDLYKQMNYGERYGKCYIIRKGSSRKDLPQEFDGPIIDDLSEEDKVKVFNRCKYCISYDTQTAYAGLASVCGCVSVVIPEKGKTRQDYAYEVPYGIAVGWSDDELKYAVNTREKLLEYSKNKQEQQEQSVSCFIKECTRCFDVDSLI